MKKGGNSTALERSKAVRAQERSEAMLSFCDFVLTSYGCKTGKK